MSGILLARTPEDIIACLEAGDPVDSKHPVTGESALLLAAQRCDVEAARLLVQSGADPVGSGALRKAIDLQDFAMARALLKPLPVFDQLCYWRQLVWSCVLTRTAAMLRRWPLYGLPSEVLRKIHSHVPTLPLESYADSLPLVGLLARRADVMVSGIVSRAELNGLNAVVLGTHGEPARYMIRVTKSGEEIKVKAENLHGIDLNDRE